MCGRYYIDDDDTISEMRTILNELSRKYQGTPMAAEMKTGEIFPTNTAPVIVADKDSPSPVLMRWGYPKWKDTGVIINARAETAEEKRTFSTSIAHRRCILPANGFYEWNHEDGHPKQKYLLREKENPMLYMGGLYSSFEDRDGSRYFAYVILTVNANSSVSGLHDRMPLIMDPDKMLAWLTDEDFARRLLVSPCLADLSLSPV
jgi:putative SOS response-associated peptidase YedK